MTVGEVAQGLFTNSPKWGTIIISKQTTIMTRKANPFFTKAERETLIGWFMECLEDMDQLDEYPNMEQTLRSCNNSELKELCVDFMPSCLEDLARTAK